MSQPKQLKRTRGRPRLSKEQIESTRNHISSCALHLFQQEGYDAVSMRRLSQETGLTVMTIYKYFDAKIEILCTIWADIFAELFDNLDKIAANEPDDVDRLHAVALGYVTYWLNHRPHYFMVFMSKGISQSDVSSFLDDTATVKRFQLFNNCLSAVHGDNVEPEISRVKSELLICLLNGIAHNQITISSYPWSEPEVLVREAIEGLVATC